MSPGINDEEEENKKSQNKQHYGAGLILPKDTHAFDDAVEIHAVLYTTGGDVARPGWR